MAIRIVIYGKEVANPAVKVSLALLAMFFIGLFLLVACLILLPLLGIAVTLSAGLLAFIFVFAFVSTLAFVMRRAARRAFYSLVSRFKRKNRSISEPEKRRLVPAKADARHDDQTL